MLDENGFIKVPARVYIQPAFRSVVNDAVAMLTGCLGDLIHSIYLYGSVARGEAVAGVSDLDICLLLRRKADFREETELPAMAEAIECQHRVVSKVDFDIGTLEEALNPANLYSWGYWLKHHCRCLYGDDISRRFPLFRPSRAIALAVNGDFFAVLEGYIATLNEEKNIRRHQQLRRSASRKLIRSTNILRTAEDTDWPDSLEEHLLRFATNYPAMADSLRYFYQQNRQPQGDSAQFITNLSHFMMWLNERARDIRYNSPPHSLIHSDPQ